MTATVTSGRSPALLSSDIAGHCISALAAELPVHSTLSTVLSDVHPRVTAALLNSVAPQYFNRQIQRQVFTDLIDISVINDGSHSFNCLFASSARTEEQRKDDSSTPGYAKFIIELLLEMKSEIKDLKRENSDLKRSNNDLVQEVLQLKTTNAALQFEVNSLKSDSASREVVTPNSASVVHNDKDNDDPDLKRSIVVYGVTELSCPNAIQRAHHDFNCITDILDFLDIQCLPISVFRMGKPNQDKPRLLKVVLPTSRFQADVLRRAPRLRFFSHHGIFIRPSLSRLERMRRRDLIRGQNDDQHLSCITSHSHNVLSPSSQLNLSGHSSSSLAGNA